MSEENARVGIRWTIGDVSVRGYEALRLSIMGAWKLFGPDARYAVCVNSVTVESARALTGEVPESVEWHPVEAKLPGFLGKCLDPLMAEGTAWKLVPLRMFPDMWELSLDNDCILWERPHALVRWLAEAESCLLAADVTPCFGQFASQCPKLALNTGIRGFPPGFDPGLALARAWERHPVPLVSETDEQGLQVAAYLRCGRVHVVSVEEVTICSPFFPHQEHLGRCGAHFVGLNARHIPWRYYGRPAMEYRLDHWERHRERVLELIGEGMVLAGVSAGQAAGTP